MTETVQYRFLIRRGTAAALAALNEVPLSGEMILVTDEGFTDGKYQVKFGDGITHYNDLPFLKTDTTDNAVTELVIDTSGHVSIDCSLGNYFTLALTSNVTDISFTNLPAAGTGQSIMLRMKQDATGSRTVALPSSFKAIDGSDTAVQATANAYTVLAMTTFDQGTRWEYVMRAGG